VALRDWQNQNKKSVQRLTYKGYRVMLLCALLHSCAHCARPFRSFRHFSVSFFPLQMCHVWNK